ncbi:hypothetical protein [Deinococcus peraridilitoris]|uniref:Uncharacterized protein n=1 Tax=Deinococcus peraridilitoris (strain DSM 19664 / LMG 22246 / CIP 109416 / KR-200) TaxID=937777 RepID=L0A2Z5_DEIPD|nr:hypothetical protein [Deinococcus peraridilitoris]AFZ67552.1 hypothetical protein Deipe_2056 [Deinococcus peraridilitoris DSM 19664]
MPELFLILIALNVILFSLAVSADTRARKAERLAQRQAARISTLEQQVLPKRDHWGAGR